MNNPSNIKKSQQHRFDSWFGLTEFFWLWEIGDLVHFAISFHVHIGRHVSSPVMTRPKVSSCLSKRSWQIVTLLCFCSLVNSFGTFFAHIFLMSRSSVKIFLTFSLPMFTCSVLLTLSRRFSRTIWRIFAMLSSVMLVARQLLFVSDTFSSLRKTFYPL